MVEFAKRVPGPGADAVGAILKAAADPKIISFGGGLPAPEMFPVEAMKKAADQVFDKHGRQAMQYGASEGILPLRQYITEHVQEKENIQTDPAHVLVTTGSEQAIDLVAKAYLDEGDTVLVEQPTYLCAIDVFKIYGAKFVGVEMDEDGMKMDALEETLKAHPEAKLIYTVPNFQNPTGRTLAADRRKKLAELAAKYDVIVLEDNPYGEIRFAGEHLPAVKSYDQSDHVLYMGTFSKTLAPGFRLGWVIGPEKVIGALRVLKQSADLHTDNFVQYAVTQFVADNDLDQHVAKISKLYAQRKDLMIEGIKKYFPAGVKYTNPDGGMFLWVEVPGVKDSIALFKQCLEHGVAFVPGDSFYAGQAQPGTFRLNFSNMAEDKINEGMKLLGDALKEAIG